MIDDKQKFCIFVPCHNEGGVIKATVENYININYNKDLFDIFFIADNCQDDTAKEIRQAIDDNKIPNFFLFERFVDDPKKKGKPHALRWAIDQLEKDDKFYNKYDMFMILDADNFVDADILKHINSQYLSYKENKRPVMIQTYLDSKNKNSLVARSYYTAYRVTNRFFQLPHHCLGLNLAVGGTGFAMTTEFLKEIGGYNCKSLTEDLEIQSIATLKGKRIVHNINTRVYDEKPTGVKQAYVQRTRWAQGHWFLFFKYYFLLLINLFNFKTI
ncbi:MAG: glycosyltransferase family 2 protein, partial [Christensenellales bacterium]